MELARLERDLLGAMRPGKAANTAQPCGIPAVCADPDYPCFGVLRGVSAHRGRWWAQTRGTQPAAKSLARTVWLLPTMRCRMPVRHVLVLYAIDELHDAVDDIGEVLGQAGKPNAGTERRPRLLANLAQCLELGPQ